MRSEAAPFVGRFGGAARGTIQRGVVGQVIGGTRRGFTRVSNLKGGILAWIDKVDPSQTKY